ncbi:MAG TPA: LamG-like jellyroll fold domain-containing protein, partial [Tepidisphaeraceae bacterium]|nr:LamG-like jellyroll fold domain-containing protein [Tepidisphaeraceae bacterium]
TFEEGKGDTVGDVSGIGEALKLKIADPGAVRWTDQGLEVHKPTLIATDGPPAKLLDALRKSTNLTVEAWVTPADVSQAGPARIVTLSKDPLSRNVTLAQERDGLVVRLRSEKTDANGLPPLDGPGTIAAGKRTHVVYTRDTGGKARLYVDGRERAARDVGGKFSNWDSGFRLALANELTRDRPWRGTLHLVALYDRDLAAEEISRNHAAGFRKGSAAAPAVAAVAGEPSKTDLQALYRFDEGGGDTVRDRSGAGEPINLKIESASAVIWDGAGLTVNEPTLIASTSPPQRLIAAVKKSGAVTIEAWVAPKDVKQAGPSRVVTLSADPARRNFTLGQDGDKYDVRLRSTGTDANGIPSLVGRGGTAKAALTHVVYTRNKGGQARLFINGEETTPFDVGGDLSNWDGDFRLALANELTKDRPWRGTFRRVAIYSRALSAEEIRAQGLLAAPQRGIARYDLSNVPSRGGLLTQASVLTVGGEEASTVERGLFVLKDLLYSSVGSAPPGVDTTPVPTKPGLSQRAIAEGRLAISSCSGCHSKFEPLAFALGRFDGIGGHHEKDEHGNGLRDDGKAFLPGRDEPVEFKSSAEFMDLLAKSDRVKMNITRKVTQFALGRPLVESDGPELEKIHKAAQEGGGTYASLMTALVMSDLVQKTRTEPTQAERTSTETSQ